MSISEYICLTLWKSWSFFVFVLIYSTHKTISAIEQFTIFPNAEIKKQEDEVLKLLKDGHSYRAIKNTTGKSINFVKRIAQQAGLQSDFDSSMYNNRTRYWINILAQLGRNREGIASHLEVNIGIVDQVIQISLV